MSNFQKFDMYIIDINVYNTDKYPNKKKVYNPFSAINIKTGMRKARSPKKIAISVNFL